MDLLNKRVFVRRNFWNWRHGDVAAGPRHADSIENRSLLWRQQGIEHGELVLSFVNRQRFRRVELKQFGGDLR